MVAPCPTAGSRSGGGGSKENRSSLDRYYDHDMGYGRPGYRSSRDHDDEERERRRRDREREEAERKRRRRDPDWEEAERERRRRDRDWEEAERGRRRRDLDSEEMKRERRCRDPEGEEKESNSDSERWKRRGEDEEESDTKHGMNKEGTGRKRTRWDDVGDNGASSTFAVMAAHPVAPLSTVTSRPHVLQPGLLPAPCRVVDSTEKDSECLLLENVFDGSLHRDDQFYLDVKDYIHRGCARCGPVQHNHVDRKGFVYLRFYDKTTAANAKEKWHGNRYEGSVITAKFMDDLKYRSRFPF